MGLVRPDSDDTLVFLGDYVDHGPDSAAVLDWLVDFQSRARIVALRGNHDNLMLKARRGEGVDKWLSVGGRATVLSYGVSGEPGGLSFVPESHWRFLESTVPSHETETHLFVHANLRPDLPLREQPGFMLYCERFRDPPPHRSGKIMVCGHTSQASGAPLDIGHAICLETRVYAGGWLTCLDTGSRRYWQASQAGEVREGSRAARLPPTPRFP